MPRYFLVVASTVITTPPLVVTQMRPPKSGCSASILSLAGM